MHKATVVATENGRVLGVHTWTEGFKPLKCPRKRVMTEDDILAVALWFEKHGQEDAALAFLELHVDLPRVQ